MLRRRILASAMASVMAIGSVAVVANAEDAAVATKQVKTKADLEAYVKSFDSFMTGGLKDYGSVSNDRFSKVMDFCLGVLSATGSGIDDYTAAYKMLEATYNSLRIYSAEELKALITDCTPIYNTNNVMNEEFGDAIYKDDNGQWGAFTSAFESAETVVASADSSLICDAYEELTAAKNNLTALTSVTKAQFRTTLKALESALQNEYKYDSWRRGTIEGDMSWAFDGASVAWGVIFYSINDQMDGITEAYKLLDERKSVNKTTNEDITKKYEAASNYVAVLNGFTADNNNRGSRSSVKGLLDEYHGQLVFDYATTAADGLYRQLLGTIQSWEGDVTVKQTQGDGFAFKKASEVGADVEDAFYTVDAYPGIATSWSGWKPGWMGTQKTISAELTVKSPAKRWLILNEDGYADIYNKDANGNYIYDSDGDPAKIAAAIVTTQPSAGTKFVTINKNAAFDITKYIAVKSTMVSSGEDNHEKNDVYDGDTYSVNIYTWHDETVQSSIGGWVLGEISRRNGTEQTSNKEETVKTYTTLDDAMSIAEYYINHTKADDFKNYNDIYRIDTAGIIGDDSASGKSQEFAIVYRYLKYALEDKYKASTGTKTRADVNKLIEDSYELAEATGDSALFSYNHNRLVEARQAALDWLKAANKDLKYKDPTSTEKFIVPVTNEVIKATATDVFNNLNGYYWALNNDYQVFQLSVGEVFYKLAEVADMIDSEELTATDALVNAMNDVAVGLVNLQSLDDAVGVSLDNNVFTDDDLINKYSRIYTKDGEYWRDLDISATDTNLTVPAPDASGAVKSHNNLKKAYEALLAEVKAQTEVKTVVGDVNGDGVVNALDAAAILKAVAAGTAIDVAVGDYNADGVVNALDAAAILKAVTQA